MLPGSTYSKSWCPNTICCVAVAQANVSIESRSQAYEGTHGNVAGRKPSRTVVGKQAQQRGKEEAPY